MKAYPTNFKKLKPLNCYPVGTKLRCFNGCIVEINNIDSAYDTINGTVTFVTPALGQHIGMGQLTGALWNYSGAKEYPRDWPPGMNIKEAL